MLVMMSISGRRRKYKPKPKITVISVVVCAFLVMVRIHIMYSYVISHFNEPKTITIIDEEIHDNIITYSPSEIKPKPKPKPKLILHVGPQKTASTTIQDLISYHVRSALLEENYTVVEFNFRRLKRLTKNCFLNSPGERDCAIWDSLVDSFDNLQGGSNSFILSNEELANMPINNVTTPLWQNLLDKLDIQVLIFYRPFHQWIYSMYAQHRKNLMYRSGGDVWIEWFGRQEEVRNFPEWLEDHLSSNLVDLRDTIAVKNSFEELFGSDRVHVLDMMAPHGVEIEFLGNDIVNAVQARDVVERGEKQYTRYSHVKNPASSFVLDRMDIDHIIVEGHRQHVGDLGRYKLRKTSRIKFEGKLKEWNMTTADLPRVCPSQEQENWLWDRTIYLQRLFSRYPLPEEELRREFSINRKKWCGVDALAVLKNSTWREYLSSCEFSKIGCKTDIQNHTRP